jgi:glycosyltransferase involved in cell wall biosynthesis
MSGVLALLADAQDPQTFRWSMELANRGWEVHVLSLQMGGIPGVRIHAMMPSMPGKLGRAMLAKQFKGTLDALAPDVVHAFDARRYGLLARQVGRHPLVVSLVPSDLPALSTGRFFERRSLLRTLREADTIQVSSLTVAHAAAHHAKGCRIEVIQPGIDLDRFAPGEDPEVPTIGCALPLESEGGQEFLLCALRLIVQRNPDRPLRLLLAGEGTDRDSLDQLSRELAMANRTTFVGYVAPADRPRFLRGLSVYALPAVADTGEFGMEALEAAACGLPVVASWVGGMGETVLDEVTGLLVPPRDPENLADAIERLLDDGTLRADMGANGRALVRRSYDWAKSVDQMEALYESLMGFQPVWA